MLTEVQILPCESPRFSSMFDLSFLLQPVRIGNAGKVSSFISQQKVQSNDGQNKLGDLGLGRLQKQQITDYLNWELNFEPHRNNRCIRWNPLFPLLDKMWSAGGKKPPAIVLPIIAPMDFKCVALRGPGTEDYSNSMRQHTAVALVYWQMRPWGQECKDDTKHTEIWINVGPLGTDTAQFGFLSPTELHFVFQSLSQSPSLDLAFLDYQLPDTALPFLGFSSSWPLCSCLC